MPHADTYGEATSPTACVQLLGSPLLHADTYGEATPPLHAFKRSADHCRAQIRTARQHRHCMLSSAQPSVHCCTQIRMARRQH
eukprot:2068197-Pleurochrysis_carterae.AAC.1